MISERKRHRFDGRPTPRRSALLLVALVLAIAFSGDAPAAAIPNEAGADPVRCGAAAHAAVHVHDASVALGPSFATPSSRASIDSSDRYDSLSHPSRVCTRVSVGVFATKGVPRAARGGESAAAAYGRRIHQEYDYGPGFVKEFRDLPSGRRPDAVNLQERVVVELKPNNPAAIRRGQRQLDVYRRELEQEFGGTFRTRLETYDRPGS